MKYALFVLGMILIVVGGYFLFSGSNIIEVERGWASVISGTTALTGGVITLGLAGIVKSLEDLRRLGPADVTRPAIAAGRVETPVAAIVTSETPIAFDIPPVLSTAEAISPFETDVTAAEPPLPPAPEVIPNPLPSQSKERPRLTPQFGRPQFERPQEKSEPLADVAALRQRVADDFSLDWPEFGQHSEPAVEPPAPPEPALTEVTPPPLHLDDLDADDSALPPREAEPEPHETEPDVDPAPTAAVDSEIVEADEPPASDAPKPKAIGRYEADGTVYVMFADGSIEAQSAEGTRNFKSMADLKASFHA